MRAAFWSTPGSLLLGALVALLLPSRALAAPANVPVLSAQVRLDRLDGPPLAGVSVLIGQKMVAQTDAQGRFQLPWPRPSPAAADKAPVTLQLSRPGEAMAVINDVLLTWPASLTTSPAPVTLLVSAPETVTTWREFHLGQLVLRTSEQARVAALAAASAAASAAAAAAAKAGPQQLKMEGPAGDYSGGPGAIDSFGQLAGTWALLTDKGPATQMPALYRQALHAWWRGDPAQALQALPLDVLQRAPSGTPAADAGLAQAWMLRAVLQSTLRDHRGATDTGWLATIALPDRPEPWHLLGQLLMHQLSGSPSQAHGALTRALALYPTDNTAAIARLHDTLGRLLEGMKRPREAGEHWLKAMALHAAMRSDADTVHTDAASRAGLNAARMQAMVGQHAQALATLSDVLVWRRALATREPTLMRQYELTTTLLNQELSHQKLKQTCLGEAAWREARSIASELAEIDPARFLERKKQSARPPLPPGTCQNTEASALRSHTPLPLPTSAVLEALPAAEWKAQIEAWQDESRMQEGMAPAQSALAAQWSLAALGLQLRLAASEPGQHEQALARTLTRIGSLHQMSGKPALALASYREALAAWGKVQGTRDAPRWLPDIVETLKGRIAHLQAKPSP